MRHFLIVIFIILTYFISYGQMTIFEQGYSKSIGMDTTRDAGYIVVGSTAIHFGGDYTLSKMDANGNQLLYLENNKYDGLYMSNSMHNVKELSDGSYLLMGQITDSNMIDKGYIVKTDSAGNKIWEKSFFGISMALSCYEESNGNLIVIGVKQNAVVMRLNSIGDSIGGNVIAGINGWYYITSPIYFANGKFISGLGFHVGISVAVKSIIFGVDSLLQTSWQIIFDGELNDSRLELSKLKLLLHMPYPVDIYKIDRIDIANQTIDSKIFNLPFGNGCFGDDDKVYSVNLNSTMDTLTFTLYDSLGNKIWSVPHQNFEITNQSIYHRSTHAFISKIQYNNGSGGGAYFYKIADTTSIFNGLDYESFSNNLVQFHQLDNRITLISKEDYLTVFVYNLTGQLEKTGKFDQGHFSFEYNTSNTVHLIVVRKKDHKIFSRLAMY